MSHNPMGLHGCYRDSYFLHNSQNSVSVERSLIHLSSTAHLQVAAGRKGLQILNVAANRQNKQLKKADKGCFSKLVTAWKANSCLQ
jgi:hypothetical protein